jgi:hypothetical protein
VAEPQEKTADSPQEKNACHKPARFWQSYQGKDKQAEYNDQPNWVRCQNAYPITPKWDDFGSVRR